MASPGSLAGRGRRGGAVWLVLPHRAPHSRSSPYLPLCSHPTPGRGGWSTSDLASPGRAQRESRGGEEDPFLPKGLLRAPSEQQVDSCEPRGSSTFSSDLGSQTWPGQGDSEGGKDMASFL